MNKHTNLVDGIYSPKPYKENKFAETVVGLLLAIGFVCLLYAILMGY